MQVMRVQAGRGWSWMADGFKLLAREPLSLFGTAAALMLTLTLAGLFPLIGPLAIPALIPMLTVGFITAARTVDEGRKPTPLMLFDGFRLRNRARLRQLLALGLINAVLTAVALGIALLADGGALFRTMTGAGEAGDPSAQGGEIAYGVLVFVVLSVPIQMVMWYSPLFVAWNQRGPVEAVFFSIVACWRNKGAFAVYAASWIAVLTVVSLVALMLRPLLPSDDFARLLLPGNPFSPVTLVLIAALYCSFWPSYRDVVREGPDVEA